MMKKINEGLKITKNIFEGPKIIIWKNWGTKNLINLKYY